MKVQRAASEDTPPLRGQVVFYTTKPGVHYLWFSEKDTLLVKRLYPDLDFVVGLSYVQISTDFYEAVKLFEHVVNTMLFVPLFYCAWDQAYALEINTGT